MKKLIYLDSSDFSDLSLPVEQLSMENKSLIKELVRQRDEETATFCLSIVHVSEAVHAAAKYKQAAVYRARLMRDLCGQITLRTPTDIFALELERAFSAQNPRLSRDEVMTANGEWFGQSLFNKQQVIDWRKQARESFNNRIACLPRNERRRLKAELNPSRKAGRERLREMYRKELTVVDTKFPFNLLDRNVFLSWYIGELSDDELCAKIARVISDPYILFEYLLENEVDRTAIYSPIRNVGASICLGLDQNLRRMRQTHSRHIDQNFKLPWKELFDEIFPKPALCQAMISGYAKAPPARISDTQAEAIVDACPAFSIFVNATIAYVRSIIDANISKWNNGSESINSGKPSDFGDFMHIGYAAYVDVLRCDSRFGALIRQNVSVRNKIIDKRSGLLSYLSNQSNRAA